MTGRMKGIPRMPRMAGSGMTSSLGRHWLMKSEPTAFSIEDLRSSKNRTAPWDGVRNYQARNFLRDEIQSGDGVLFYHSSVEPVGISGEALVVRGGYPDHTAFDPKNEHHDPKSDPNRPTWYMVDVKFVRACREIISLKRLKEIPALKNMVVLRRGARLSVQPVSAPEWAAIMKLPEWD